MKVWQEKWYRETATVTSDGRPVCGTPQVLGYVTDKDIARAKLVEVAPDMTRLLLRVLEYDEGNDAEWEDIEREARRALQRAGVIPS